MENQEEKETLKKFPGYLPLNNLFYFINNLIIY